jgi:uncharacterized small protein (DUF1192 family)
VGRATIQGEDGAGRYTISLDYGTAEINAEIAVLNTRIAELDADIAQLEAKMASEQSAVNALWAALDAAIAVYKDDRTDENRQAIDDASTAALEGSATYRAAKEALADRKLRRSQLATEKSTLAAEVLTETRSAWCVDYTEQATGAVATIELNGEGPEVLLAPSAPAPVTGDGVMKDRLAMSGAATFLNAAILPGWQKYSPTFRAGVITALDRENDTCSVRLEAAASSAQSLDINQASNLTDVPIEYMTCNAAAFVVGDEVVVQFENQDWSRPKVIGFRSNPRPCGPERIWFPVGFDGATLVDGYGNNNWKIGLWRRGGQGADGVSVVEWRSGEFDSPPSGDGWVWHGEGNVVIGGSNLYVIRIIFGGGGVLASIKGDGPSATWRTDYTCSLGDFVMSSQQVAAWTQISEGDSFVGTDIEARDTFVATGPDWQFDDTNMSPSSPPTFYDDRELDETGLAAIAAKNAFMETYFGNPPSPITLTAEGGGGVVYEFMRWGIIGEQSKPFNSEFPAVQAFGGLAAIYRLRRT